MNIAPADIIVAAPNGQITDEALTGDPVAGIARVGLEGKQTWLVRGVWRFGQVCLFGLVGLGLWAMLPVRFYHAEDKNRERTK